MLTMITREQKFMFGLPMLNKKSESVINELNKLEDIMKENFNKLFEIGITDNGSEFLNYEEIETSVDKISKRLDLKYADAYASYQKPLVENNHRLIRYIIEKGYDMANLTREEIINIMNRVNNYPRKSLNFSTPYLEMRKALDEKVLAKLGFYYIPVHELDMKSKRIV